MRITYVARSFLDYRIPVLMHLNWLCDNQLRFISSTKWTPKRALERLRQTIGDNAIYLSGEKSIGVDVPNHANKSICIPYQPGLMKAILNTHPDVLIGDGFFQWTYAPLMLRITKRIPLVVCYERWTHTERNAQWYRKNYRKMALKFVDAACCNGRLSKDYTVSLGMSADKITTGHMAADTVQLTEFILSVTEDQKKALRQKFDLKGIVFLFVGRLIKIKGVAQMLDAWSDIERYKADATLFIVGGGPEEQSLKEQQSRLGLKRVRFAGSINYNQLPLFYAAADVFVIPTLEDNWSLVVPEAMSCGLPILCSKYNGCWPELVKEGENGWVFDPLDRKNTLGILKKAFNAQSGFKDMAQRSNEIVKKYSPENAAKVIFKACQIATTPKVHLCTE